MTAHVPGPLRRLLRQPLRAVAIGLLAVTALAASGIHSAAALALQRTLDENWRGLYDILVTAGENGAGLDGLLPPNTLTSASESLTIAQWQQVATLGDVDVAAPIGEILTPAVKFGVGQLVIPVSAVPESVTAPQGFALTVTYTTDDGLGERIVDQSDVRLIIDATPPPEGAEVRIAQCVAASEASYGSMGGQTFFIDREKYPDLLRALCSQGSESAPLRAWIPYGGSSWSGFDSEDDHVIVNLADAPQPVTRITLVDPASERALLGEAGGFLEPLIASGASAETRFAEMEAWAKADASTHGAELLDRLTKMAVGATSAVGDDTEAWADLVRLYRDNGADLEEEVRSSWADQRFVPVLVAEQDVAPLSIKVDITAVGAVEQVGDPRVTNFDLAPFESSGSPVGTVVGDVSALMNPLIATGKPVSWPGTEVETEQHPHSALGYLAAVGKAESIAVIVEGGGFIWEPHGYAAPVRSGAFGAQWLSAPAQATDVGAEAAYLSPSVVWEAGEGGTFLAPLGTFDAAALRMNENAAIHVPLGAYDPVSSLVTAGAHAGATMSPGVSGYGLVSSRTAAIASIHSAGIWEDTAPIAAIRMRVAGIDAYTAASRARVVAVAQQIEALGLTATVVAGSSPAAVDVQVEGYAFGVSDATATQTVGALGTITQRWSELGAAARVSVSVSGTALAILGIALAAAVLLLAAVQVSGIPGRSTQAAVMRDVGFTRPRIARWFAAEEAPGVIVVAGIAALAVWISAGTAIARGAAVVIVAVVLVAAVASVVAGSQGRMHARARDLRSRRLGARSVAGFGARQVLVHPLTSTVHVLAIVLVGLATAALTAVVISGIRSAGASNLALLTLGQQLAPQLALGLAGVLCGMLLARFTRRLDLIRRQDQWQSLRAAGWPAADLRTAQRVEGLTIVVPALAVTIALTIGGVVFFALTPAVPLICVAAVGALGGALLTFSTHRKGTGA